MVRVLMNGCNGKMGQVVSRIVAETEGMELAAGVDQWLGRENPYPTFASIEACDVPVDVVIDFSNAAGTDAMLEACVEKGLPIVLCTTGLSEEQIEQVKKIQKAMAIIQFKVEARLIEENPSFGLDDRNLLHLVDYENKSIVVDGVEYELLDTFFPTVDPADPYRLTPGEEQVVEHLCAAFTGCEKLQRHIGFFITAGSLYKVSGNNLLYHACVPLNADGSFKEANIYGQTLSGKALFDAVDGYVRAAYEATDPVERKRGCDLLWYLWLAPGSPLFAKSKMATFELYLIADKAARKEVKNPYYSMLDDPAVVRSILEEFGLDAASGRLLCGHVPVKVKDGENPIKAGGQALMIDGGFSAAYQGTTGLGGMCMVSSSDGVELDLLEPFDGRSAAIENDADLRMERRAL